MNRAYDLARTKGRLAPTYGGKSERAAEQRDEADEGRLEQGRGVVAGHSAIGRHRGRLEKVAPFAAYPWCSADREGGVIEAGYFARIVSPTPEGLNVHGVDEICSVSTCISSPPDEWVSQWRHNEFGWFNTIDDAWAVVPEADRSRHRLFAYKLALTRFRKGEPLAVRVPEDVHPTPIPESFVSLGYDAVSKFMESVLGLECSPLSCNALAGEFPANEHCLFDTEAEATSAARRFSIEEPEPGEYYVVQVLEVAGPSGRRTRG